MFLNCDAVGSKIIGALEIIRVKKLVPNAVLRNEYCNRIFYAYFLQGRIKILNICFHLCSVVRKFM